MYLESDLVRIGKRENNKKRNYLVVNRLQGKHIPVLPSEALSMFDALAEIIEKEYMLLQRLYKGLEGYVEFYSSLQNSTSIVAFNIPHKDSAYVSDILNYKYGIITRCGAHCAPLMHKYLKTEKRGIVRLSLSFQNSIEDIDLTIRAIREISNDH